MIHAAQVSLTDEGDILPNAQNIESAYNKVVWVNRCIRIIFNSIGSVPLGMFTENAKKESVSNFEHDAIRLLRSPNGIQTGNDLIESLVMWYLIRGLGYLWMEPGADSNAPPVGLRVLPSKLVTTVVREGQIVAYAMRLRKQQKKFFPAKQIIALRAPSPNSELEGVSPTHAALQIADTDYAAEIAEAQVFRRGMRLSGILSLSEEATQEEGERVKADMRSQSGAANAHGVMVMGPNVSFTNLVSSMQDMDFLNLRNFSRDAILAAYGVPKIMLMPEGANRSNAVVQERIFWTHTLLPIMSDIEALLNRFYMPRFSGTANSKIRFDLSQVQAMRPDELERSDIASSNVRWGIKTPNEVRQANGDSPRPGGDSLWLPVSHLPAETLMLRDPNAASPPPPPADDDDKKKPEDDDTKLFRFARQQRKNLLKKISRGADTVDTMFNLSREKKRATRLLGAGAERLTESIHADLQNSSNGHKDLDLETLVNRIYDGIEDQLRGGEEMDAG